MGANEPKSLRARLLMMLSLVGDEAPPPSLRPRRPDEPEGRPSGVRKRLPGEDAGERERQAR
ncbi:MAG: hypothetical protein ACODAU_06635 [Myxococcota bacterium]